MNCLPLKSLLELKQAFKLFNISVSLIFCKTYCGGQISCMNLYIKREARGLHKLGNRDKGNLMLGYFYTSLRYCSLWVEIKFLNVAIRQ